MAGQSLVVGVGNRLLGPDGFGPAVVDQLRASTDLAGGVELVDAGTDLFSWIDRFAAFDHVVLVDAILGSGSGEVLTLDEPQFSAWSMQASSSHNLAPVVAVGLFRCLNPTARTRITLVALDTGRIGRNEPLLPSAVEAGARAVQQLVSTSRS